MLHTTFCIYLFIPSPQQGPLMIMMPASLLAQLIAQLAIYLYKMLYGFRIQILYYKICYLYLLFGHLRSGIRKAGKLMCPAGYGPGS